MSNEIHPAVDANNVQAQREAEALRKQADEFLNECRLRTEVLKRRRCKRATLALLIRVVVTIALCSLVCICKTQGLMTWEVAFVAVAGLSSWLCLWVGAWMQFLWGKEGLLR
jgi:hypothetical protein